MNALFSLFIVGILGTAPVSAKAMAPGWDAGPQPPTILAQDADLDRFKEKLAAALTAVHRQFSKSEKTPFFGVRECAGSLEEITHRRHYVTAWLDGASAYATVELSPSGWQAVLGGTGCTEK